MNLEALASLSKKGLFAKYDNTRLQPGEVKYGMGYSNLVVGPERIVTNTPEATNPGFSFTPQGSTVRSGGLMNFDRDYQSMRFKGGDQQFNPLGDAKASSTTDPLPQIVQTLPLQHIVDLTDIASNLQKLIGL